MGDHNSERIPCFCALCVSRCGAIATVTDGRFVALSADPEHPTGQALCLKGKVAPEIVHHTKRLLSPLKRTRPKGDADPGWVEIGWDEALDTVAANLRRIAAEHGPETVIRTPVVTRYRKYAETRDGVPAGFKTPSRRIELYSEEMLDHGYPPLPEFEEPRVSPRSRGDLAARFPLILTSAKDTHFCETQHRNVPSLRRRVPDPQVELHPDLAAARGIGAGDWVRITTPVGSVLARARLNGALHEDVVCGQHGWWEPCEEIGAPGYDPYGSEGANFNLLIDRRAVDPVSGTPPHRSFICQVTPT